ncbi:hypothetical protein [Luteimonas sp. R10]|uniref:hypothetical protein n=1 Tax=Luteimonas sp. R10 TaxID=3108176 RepID=UPI00308505EB|nr:hypothetical protein U3649_09665 [Luteimonas sp. R10]
MHQQLFRLSHLAIGSKKYAQKKQLERGDDDDTQSDWGTYYIHIRNAVSNDLIELATKVRVAQDAMLDHLEHCEVQEIDAGSIGETPIGTVLSGSFRLTIRESCNKIIHAKHVDLGIGTSRNAKPAFRYNYWNGHCKLRGAQEGQSWEIDLNIFEWCQSMTAFAEEMSQYVEW